MVLQKPVKSLRACCLKIIPNMVALHIRKVASQTSALSWYSNFEGAAPQLDHHEGVIHYQVGAFRLFVSQQVIWYDLPDVFGALLKGVEEALAKTRSLWKPSGDMAQYKAELEAVSNFTDIVLLSKLRRVDFRHIPRSLRSRIVNNLNAFTETRVLVLGLGGHWMFKSQRLPLLRGLASMPHLTKFVCKNDATLDMVRVLSQNCTQSLTILDVENSKGIQDEATEFIASMSALEELNLFHTPMGHEAKARLLMALPHLTRLARGDFLCEALTWIDSWSEQKSPQFLLTDFFPSQDYFFHEAWQMEQVSRMCPFVGHMRFIWHVACAPSYMVLAAFEYITALDLHGGSFFRHEVETLVHLRGARLQRLNLIAMADVNYLALSLIARSCTSLVHLGLHNCTLGGSPGPISSTDSSVEEQDRRRAAHLLMARQGHAQMPAMPQVEEVVLRSGCSAPFFIFLLGRCPGVRRICLGPMPELGDEALVKVHALHGLLRLEEFHCDRAPRLGRLGLQLLMEQCPRLKVVGDLQAWSGLSPADVGAFRQSIFRDNLDLDTRSHRQLRLSLEMEEVFGDTHEVWAGPSLERIRRAERERPPHGDPAEVAQLT